MAYHVTVYLQERLIHSKRLSISTGNIYCFVEMQLTKTLADNNTLYSKHIFNLYNFYDLAGKRL